ncbi:MAG: 4-(cytidine 5'-diphospho)-2-C-methyl-D-erythritol kinase [Thermodesulfobacteriota bacterium]
MGDKIDILCPAKVNLFLKVMGKRDDGYHEIISLMQPVELFDEIILTVSDGDGITLKCDTASIPSGQENLAWKAADLFLRETAIKRAVSIVLKKRIPSGGGLGGGSSDAAGVLMGLNEILGAGLNEERLKLIASLLGSDVPFFILKGPAFAYGRGEILERATLPLLYYVLINPGIHISTAWAYGNLSLTKKTKDNILIVSKGLVESKEKIAGLLENDLEGAVIGEYPVIAVLKGLLLDCGAKGALMSGSGSTVFGLFFEEREAEEAITRLKGKLPANCEIFLARGLSQIYGLRPPLL